MFKDKQKQVFWKYAANLQEYTDVRLLLGDNWLSNMIK